MCRDKIADFFELFPRIREYLRMEEIRTVKVSRIQPWFLYVVPKRKKVSSSHRCEVTMGKIFLLDRFGVQICEVGVSSDHVWWKPWTWLKEESVGEALQRLENPDDVYFALAISPVRLCLTSRGRAFNGQDVVFFRPPEEFTLREWLDEQQSKREDDIWLDQPGQLCRQKVS